MNTYLRRITYIALSPLVMFALAACGDGGGSSGSGDTGNSPPPPPPSDTGNSLPPSSGPGDAENFFPNATGSSWNYLTTVTSSPGTGSTAFFDVITVTGTKAVSGTTASVFLESNPSGDGVPTEDYYFKNAGGVAYLGDNDAGDALSPAVVPYELALFPATARQIAHIARNGLDFGSDLDGDGIRETVNLVLTTSIVGFEPLSLGIGSFPRSVRSTEALTGTVVMSMDKRSIALASTLTRWSVPGMGTLRTSQNTTVDTTTMTEVMEVRGYTASGVSHGFDLPYTVASDRPGNVLPVGDQPALATDGQNFLAANDDANGLVGTLFDASGATVTNVRLAPGAGSAFELAAFDGVNYWVVFSPYSSVTSGEVTSCLAQRISPAGALVDQTPINLVTVSGPLGSIGSSGIAFGKTNGLLAYTAFNLTTNQHELHGVLISPDGTVTSPFAIATDNSTHLYPAVAFDGTNFFVAWQQLATSGATAGSVYGVRVSASGQVIDAEPIAIATAPSGEYNPSVAFDGGNYLIVWLSRRNQSGNPTNFHPEVFGARVSAGGVLLDGPPESGGFTISQGGTLDRSPAHVVFNGNEYLVTWTLLGYVSGGVPGVQAVRVSTDGTLPSGANQMIPVSGPPGNSIETFESPAIAVGARRGAIIWRDIQNNVTLMGSTFSTF